MTTLLQENKQRIQSPVWEEALIQEFLYLIGHLNHSEQHLIEADSYIGYPIFGELTNLLREYRKKAGQVMFEIERLETEQSSGGEFRTSWESIWCTLKHLTTALIHTDEVIEKILKRVKENREDPESVDMLNKQIQILLEIRKGIMDALSTLIQQAKTLSQSISFSSIRCREDLCLEEIEEQTKN
jgi:uncharacterized protein YhaN